MNKINAVVLIWIFAASVYTTQLHAADHNDPNAVNSIFSNIPISAADLYGMFGYPSDDTSDGEKVVVQLTFASIPSTGVFDRDMLYKIHFDPDRRTTITHKNQSLEAMLDYAERLKDKYLKLKAAEVRVTFNAANQARLDFLGFPGGDFFRVVDTNQVLSVDTPNNHSIKVFVGGRDDPFFNDLPGFFRSINYGPQFYKIPTSAAREMRELAIPKTLLELEGNRLFNFNSEVPRQGRGVKLDLPDGPLSWQGNRFFKDAEGRYRFVYGGVDAQAGINVNAIVLEIPLAFITTQPQTERVVQIWGESWVLRAANKIDTKGSESKKSRVKAWWESWFSDEEPDPEFDNNIAHYKRIDTVGVPFLDAGLSEREDSSQLGAANLRLARGFVTRLAHLGWGFAPSISALGIPTCFDHDNAPVSVHKTYTLATAAFPRSKKCAFQKLNMPDDSWRKNPGVDIALKRVFEVFIPNVTAIDMDTTGTWPYGRRLEDQVATRFLAVFLDMSANCGDGPCHIETLGSQALWDSAPITPQTPPNPLWNDKPFLNEFPYLAEPW